MAHSALHELQPRAALDEHPQFASTLANGFDVLRCFSAARPVLGNKDIAEALGLSKPTVSRLTFTLVALGYLTRDDETRKYALAPAVLSLGYPLLVQLTVRRLAEHGMFDLARFARGPVSIGMRDRIQVVYVETVHDRDNNGAKPDIGSTRPLLRTAIGHALLSAHASRDRELLLDLLAAQDPEHDDNSRQALSSSIKAIEERGFCMSHGTWRSDLIGVAAPLRFKANGMPLALNVTLPVTAGQLDWIEDEVGPRLVSFVRDLDSRLGAEG